MTITVHSCSVKQEITEMQHIAVSCSYSVFSSNKVRLIHNEKADVLDILPLFPATRQDVPFVRGTDNNVTFSQEL